MSVRTLVFVLVPCLLLAPAALAEDEVSAAERFQKACAAMPTPAAGNGFDWTGEIVINGQAFGGCRFIATVEKRDDVAYWRTHDVAQIAQAFRLDVAGTFTRDLVPVDAKGRNKDDEEDLAIECKMQGDGLHVRIQPAGGELREAVIAVKGPTLIGMTSRILFLRSVITQKGATYEWAEPHPTRIGKDPKKKPTIVKTTARILGVGKFKGVKALLAEVKDEKKTNVFAYTTDKHAFLGVSMTEEGEATTFEMLPEGTTESSVPKDILRKPAESPQVAVGRFYLANGLHDVTLLEETFHWPTVLANVKRGNPDFAGTEDDLRKAVLEKFKASWHKQKREDPAVVELFLRGSLRSMKVEARDGNLARVAVDPNVRGIGGQKWVVVEVDGFWYMAK